MTTLRALPATISTSTQIANGSAPAGAGYAVLDPTPAAWANGTVYVAGDMVSMLGREYLCLLGNTAGTATNKPPPDIAATIFGGAQSASAYSAGTTYAIAALATFGGSTYVSIVALNVGHQPDISATQWRRISTAGDDILVYAISHTLSALSPTVTFTTVTGNAGTITAVQNNTFTVTKLNVDFFTLNGTDGASNNSVSNSTIGAGTGSEFIWQEVRIPTSVSLPGFALVTLKNNLTGTGSLIDVSFDGGLHYTEELDAGDMKTWDFPRLNYGIIKVRGNAADPTAGNVYASGWVVMP